MKILPFIFCGIAAIPAFAQTPTAPNAPAPNDELQQWRDANKASKKVPPETGFSFLLQAAEALDYNYKILPKLPSVPTPAQQLDYDRAFANQQKPAIALLRSALQQPITTPLIDGKPFDNDLSFSFSYNARYRQLARALSSESNVRAAEGDFAAALDSRLDCIELGVVVSRGTFIDMMTGSAIESIGRAKLESIIAPLDAKTCRDASARLAQIESKRPTFAEVIRIEGEQSYEQALTSLRDADTRKALMTPAGRKNMSMDDAPISEAQAREFFNLTPESLRQSNQRFYGAAIEIAALPFQKSRPKRLPTNVDFMTAMATSIVEPPSIRFIYERSALQNQLLQLALQLRAEKLETGGYPATLAAPIDSLSPDLKPLVFKRAGQSYTLYSVGPDGIDDGGKAPKTTREIFDPESGTMQTVPARGIQLGSKGDVLAPIF